MLRKPNSRYLDSNVHGISFEPTLHRRRRCNSGTKSRLNVKPTQIFALLSFSIGLSNAQVWVVDSLQRVGKSDAPGSALNIALYAAKGESESFQVIVRAPASGLSVVNLTASG